MAYTTSTLQPTEGFHPVSITSLHFPSLNSSWGLCSVHLHYTLPPLLFVDTHELAQRNESYTFRHWGSRDLERPVHALQNEPSELLVDLNFQKGLLDSDGDERILLVEVPMHLRYGTPTARTPEGRPKPEPYEQIWVDLPQAFFRCPASLHHNSLGPPVSLPERALSLLFGSEQDNALFLIPNVPNAPVNLQLPLGNQADLSLVEPLTVLTILACFFWLVQVSRRTAARISSSSTRPKIA